VFEHLDRPVSRADLIERSPAHLKSRVAERLAESGWEIFVPIRDGTVLDAVAAFELGRDAGGLDSRELAVLRRISRAASAALTSARRHRDERERDRLTGELDLARSIQRHLLPVAPPMTPLVDLSGITLPGEAVGGDSHDFLRLPDGRIALAVADVSGKGIPAAILMASAQASFRALAEEGLEPGPLMAALNRRLLEIDEPGRFLCFFYAVIDPATLELTAVNAGLEPPLLIGAQGRVEELAEGGVILGVIPGAGYEEQRRSLTAGDVLLVFSDGLVDARLLEEAPIDRERMIAIVRDRPDATADELRQAILAAAGLSGSGAADDDVTLLIARIW
jgi:sigma-B regulation protein RsbU (phosphoserine phosphatase)